ncbi:hypothetical protein A6764_15175 [Brevibacillus sp. WF146]|uniref:hypothetical protein n=1 Tax=Brevibacillus sp. WF146 TaxID=319501 RepID=UPI0007ED7B82|nr:hypothetical protein [Brevibacillus sp. WF146]UYZ12166.1 hypothetical protein A6764_15175 [Brevibacillus sp. WF146]
MMHTFLAWTLAVIGVTAVWFAGVSITAWLVSTLVEYLFAVDFGFWKAFAAIVLLGVISNVAFSGLRRANTR